MGAGYHGGFGATKGFFEGRPVAGEIVFASEDYAYINNIANRKDIDPDGLYDVVGHGTPYKIKFGDGDNDIEILRMASHSYAMENASPALLQVADQVAPHHKDQGVLTILEDYLGLY